MSSEVATGRRMNGRDGAHEPMRAAKRGARRRLAFFHRPEALPAATFVDLWPPCFGSSPGLRTAIFMPSCNRVEIVGRDDLARLQPFHRGYVAIVIGCAQRDSRMATVWLVCTTYTKAL